MPDILVNSAGIVVCPARPPSQIPVPDVRQTYETDVFGVIAVTNAMLPLLRRSRAGRRAVSLTSDLGSLSQASGDPVFPQLLAYNSSKAALNAITVTCANELRGQGILVNAVSPGPVATDRNGHQGVLTPGQGAKLPIRMAALPADGRDNFAADRALAAAIVETVPEVSLAARLTGQLIHVMVHGARDTGASGCGAVPAVQCRALGAGRHAYVDEFSRFFDGLEPAGPGLASGLERLQPRTRCHIGYLPQRPSGRFA